MKFLHFMLASCRTEAKELTFSAKSCPRGIKIAVHMHFGNLANKVTQK